MEKSKSPKYPCKNCKYFNACGDNTRTMPCKGRALKTDNATTFYRYKVRQITGV